MLTNHLTYNPIAELATLRDLQSPSPVHIEGKQVGPGETVPVVFENGVSANQADIVAVFSLPEEGAVATFGVSIFGGGVVASVKVSPPTQVEYKHDFDAPGGDYSVNNTYGNSRYPAPCQADCEYDAANWLSICMPVYLASSSAYSVISGGLSTFYM